MSGKEECMKLAPEEEYNKYGCVILDKKVVVVHWAGGSTLVYINI